MNRKNTPRQRISNSSSPRGVERFMHVREVLTKNRWVYCTLDVLKGEMNEEMKYVVLKHTLRNVCIQQLTNKLCVHVPGF